MSVAVSQAESPQSPFPYFGSRNFVRYICDSVSVTLISAIFLDSTYKRRWTIWFLFLSYFTLFDSL